MVKKILGILTREVGGLHSAAYLLGFFTILSQLLALFRDRLFANSFGAGQVLDLYYSAFKIPDFIFVSVASFVSISVLVPLISERLGKNDKELKKFIDSIFSFFIIIITLVSILVFFLSPWLLKIIFPGFAQDESFSTLLLLTRIMLLSPILLGISNFLASITQSFRRFIIYAISPLLYNIGIIVGIVFFYPYFGLAGLAYGVVFGAGIHLMVQIPFVLKVGFLPKFTVFRLRDVWQVSMVSITRTISLASSHLSTIVLVSIGSLMTVGSVAVFNLSWNMQSVPLAIVGVSYSTALFPTISKLFSGGEREKFLKAMITAARHIIFWSFPVMVLFIVLRAQIVRTILGAGEFGWSDTRLTAAALAIFSISVLSQSLVLLFTRAYYASGQTKKPLFINIVSTIIVIILGYVFWQMYQSASVFRYFLESLLRVSDLEGTEVLVLPLAYSLGMILNTVLFWYLFSKEYKGFSTPVSRTFFQSFSASIIMGGVAYESLNILSRFFDLTTALGVFAQGLFAGIIAIFAGIVVFYVLESEELKEIWRAFHKKIWGTKVIVSEQEGL